MSSRSDALEQLADLIVAVERDHPVRVAIDGVDAAGKTVLADELSPLVETRGRPVLRASIDGFHNPKEIRYRQGAESPQGYYQDSFNYQAIISKLLIPLGPEGNGKFFRKAYDYRIDKPVKESPREASRHTILLFDGVFLLRPELLRYWDYSIFVDVKFNISVARAVARDVVNSNGRLETEAVQAKYNQRYVPGQQIYLNEAKPRENANVIMQNDDFSAPLLEIRK